MEGPSSPNRLTNFGTRGDSPSMSSSTRIWPSQATLAPMPMVGIATASVMRRPSGSAIASSTTENAPASATARAALDKKRDGFRHAAAAFDLDGAAAGLLQDPGGRHEGLLPRRLIGAERH